jgi:hypothetical protein
MSDIEHRRAKVEPLWAVTHKVGEGQGDPDQTVRDERPEAKLARLEAQLAGAVEALEWIAGRDMPDGNASCATEIGRMQRVARLALEAAGGR